MSNITVDELVAAYIERRDEIARLEAAHKERIAPLKAEMEKIEGGLQHMMLETGASSFKTPHGTAYQQTWTKASVKDWNAVLADVRGHGRWEVLTHAVNKSAVLQLHEEGIEVPGVELSQGIKVNVRRN